MTRKVNINTQYSPKKSSKQAQDDTDSWYSDTTDSNRELEEDY